ncbi:hypothetical protein [Streptomyces sp. Wb2n-11]|nr:hypothetical protein [Streptomyces sp. Wb2n-11]
MENDAVHLAAPGGDRHLQRGGDQRRVVPAALAQPKARREKASGTPAR